MKDATIILEKYFADELFLADRIALENQVGDNAGLKTEFDFFESAKAALFRQQKENYLTIIRDVETQLYEEGFFIDEEEVERYLEGSLPRYKQVAFENRLQVDATFRATVAKAEEQRALQKAVLQQNTREKIVEINKPVPTGWAFIREIGYKSRAVAASFILLLAACWFFYDAPMKVRTVALANIQEEDTYKVEAIVSILENNNGNQQGFSGADQVIGEAISLIQVQEFEQAFTILNNTDRPVNMSKYLAAWCAIQSGNHLEIAIQNLEVLSKKEVYPPLSTVEIKYQLAKAYLLSNTNIAKANTILEDLHKHTKNPYSDFDMKVHTLLKTIEK